MTDHISKTNPVHPTGQPEARLFDTWIDPIETGVRERVRDWIEALIEAELNAALGCPPLWPCGGRRAYRLRARIRLTALPTVTSGSPLTTSMRLSRTQAKAFSLAAVAFSLVANMVTEPPTPSPASNT